MRTGWVFRSSARTLASWKLWSRKDKLCIAALEPAIFCELSANQAVASAGWRCKRVCSALIRGVAALHILRVEKIVQSFWKLWHWLVENGERMRTGAAYVMVTEDTWWSLAAQMSPEFQDLWSMVCLSVLQDRLEKKECLVKFVVIKEVWVVVQICVGQVLTFANNVLLLGFLDVERGIVVALQEKGKAHRGKSWESSLPSLHTCLAVSPELC